MRKQIILGLLCLVGLQGMAQKSQYFSGYVRSEYSGEDLPNTLVSLVGDSIDILTNDHGFFNLAVNSDSITVRFERSGFETMTKTFVLSKLKETQVIQLFRIENFEYTYFNPASVTDAFVRDVQSDRIQLDRTELEHVPFLLSEPDVIKSLQIRPGVEFATDGFSDLVVRGGGLSQNLLMVDGVPVYGLGHLFGFLSNFRSPMAQNVTMYKGAFPARYGGRLSSITNLQSNAGSSKGAKVDFAVSPILANLDFGLPLSESGSSIGFGVRRSYLDVIFNLQDLDLFYRDFNTRLKLVLNDKATLNLSYFNIKDRYKIGFQSTDSLNNVTLEEDFALELYNRVGSSTLTYKHNKRLTANYKVFYTHFGNSLNLQEHDFTAPAGSAEYSEYDANFTAGEIGLHADYEYRQSKASLWRFGIQNNLHQYNSGSLVRTTYDSVFNQLFKESYGDTVLQNGWETALYFENEHTFSKRFKVNAGLRTILYSYKGFTGFYPEPRLQGRYLVNSKSSVRFSYTRVNQFTHLYNTGGDATDDFIIWLPASEELKPEGSNIITLGYASRPDPKVQFLSEAYFKTLSNQPLFYSADIFNASDVVANSLTGKGRVYGWENSIRYVEDNVIIYASGTLMRSTRTYEALNRGERFSFDYDRRLIGKIGFIYNGTNVVLSAHGVLASGNPFTLPTSKYRDIDGQIILAYDEINNYRALPHNRIDMKAEWYFTDGQQSLELSIYNLLSRENVGSIYSKRDTSTTTGKYTAYQQSSFTILPFVTYRLRIQ